MAVVKLDSLYLLHETPEEDSVATRLKQKEEEKKKNGAASVRGSKGSGEFELRPFNGLYVTLFLSGPSGQLFETLPIDIPRSSGNGSLVFCFLFYPR